MHVSDIKFKTYTEVFTLTLNLLIFPLRVLTKSATNENPGQSEQSTSLLIYKRLLIINHVSLQVTISDGFQKMELYARDEYLQIYAEICPDNF